MALLAQPVEMVLEVLARTPLSALLAFAQTSKTARELVKNPFVNLVRTDLEPVLREEMPRA